MGKRRFWHLELPPNLDKQLENAHAQGIIMKETDSLFLKFDYHPSIFCPFSTLCGHVQAGSTFASWKGVDV